MDSFDGIARVLGLQEVLIERMQFHDEALLCFLEARQKREHCRCNRCHGAFSNIHSWIAREFRGPPLGIYRTVKIRLWRLRGVCDSCAKVTLSAIPFEHPEFESVTLGLFEHAGRMMEELTCEATSRLLNLDSKFCWTMDQRRMREMLKHLELKNRELNLELLSVDEVHFKSQKPQREHKAFQSRPVPKFITNLVSQGMRKVLWNAPGRAEASLSRCFERLSKEQLAQVACVAVDMNDGYWASIRKHCGQAMIAVDRYHLVEQLNQRFNEVRQEEFRKARDRNDEFTQEILKPHNRFILTQRSTNKPHSWMEEKMLQRLREINVNLQNAMLILEYFHAVLDKLDIVEFRKALTQWYRLVREAKLLPFIRFASLIRRYRLNIENYIHTRLTTAISEGINHKIQVLKRAGYQYSNQTSFRLKVLQRCGLLNSKFIDTTPWLFGRWHEPHLR